MTGRIVAERDRPPPYSFTIDGASAYSGFSRTRIEEALRSGLLKAKRAGRRTIILGDSLRNLIDDLPESRT